MAKKTVKDLGVRLTADVKDLRRKLKSLERDWDRYGKQIQKTNKRAAASRASMGGVAGGMGGGLNRSIISGGAAVAGSLGLVAAARQAKAFEESLVDVAVTGNKGRKWMARTRADVLKLSEQWAKSPEEITAGIQAMVAATGDADLAVRSVGMLTKAAFASGAEVEELARVANDLTGMLKIAPDQLPNVLDNIAEQANMGAVELKDMAQWFPVVLADLENFGWAGPEAAKGIGAFFQVAKRGNTNARNTAESIKIFTQMIAQNQGKLEKLLDVKLKKNGAWLQLPDLLKTIGDGYVNMERKGKKGLQGKFGLLVGQGKRAINPVIAAARAGWGTGVGSNASFNSLLNPENASGAIDRMASARQSLSPIHKWNVAVAKMRAEMHRHMLPLLERLANLMPTIAKAAKFALDNSEQLFALWAGAKAASFFGKMIGLGRAASAAGGGSGGVGVGSSRSGGRSAIGLGGKGAAIAGALGMGRGAFGGGAGERGADAVATLGALAGGVPGAAIGGAYFLTKAAVSIVNSEFTGTLDFAGDKEEKGLGDLAVSVAERVARRGAGVTGAGKKATTPEEQAEANKLAKLKIEAEARLAAKTAQLGGGKGGKALLKDIDTLRAISAKRKKGREKLAAGEFDSPFLMDADPDELFPAVEVGELTKSLVKADESIAKLAKAQADLARRGIHANLSPESIKQIAKAAVDAARTASGKRPSDR